MGKEASKGLHWLFFASELFIAILYGCCTEYSDGLANSGGSELAFAAQDAAAAGDMRQMYPFFQDVHVMIFVGFGFLMVFLKTHCWTSVGFNFIISCWAIQLSILVNGFWHMVIVEGHFEKIKLGMPSLITGDFAAGAVLITMGACLGKHTWGQLFLLATLELIFYGLNEAICVGILKAGDMGGSMYVHTFGAFFGVAASFFFGPGRAIGDHRCGGSYNSQLIAMVGTLFLWMYWPSFNGALAYGVAQQRVVMTTVLAMSASGLAATFMALVVKGKFEMEVLLNSTLAGGVAIGTSSDLCFNAAAPLVIGGCAGVISAAGYLHLNALLQDKVKLHDTCGVLFLHGIPGVLGATCGAVATAVAADSFENAYAIEQTFGEVKADGSGRTVQEQAWMQAAALAVTLAISLCSGVLCGFVCATLPMPDANFDDTMHFEHVDSSDLAGKYAEGKHPGAPRPVSWDPTPPPSAAPGGTASAAVCWDAPPAPSPTF